MIRFKKEKYYPDMCSSCSSKENVWVLDIQKDRIGCSTQVSLCEDCLRDLKNKIEDLLEE